jgi:hypothetical protein
VQIQADKNMNQQHETPMQEAVSYISILAFFLGVGLFYAGMNHVPVISWGLYYVAVWIYGLIPALHGLRYPQVPPLIAAVTVAGFLWIVGCCSAPKIANWISRGQLANIDRQTARLQKNRAKIDARRRVKDGFDVR